MVSERFLKLDKEKQDRILLAAREEFARVSFDQVSINQIIKNAGISRGSFYTYFDDKEDLLMYFYGQQGRQAAKSVQDKILERDGNVWQAVIEWVGEVFQYRDSPVVRQTISVLANTGLNIRPKKPSPEMEVRRMEMEEQEFQWFLAHANPKYFDMSRPENEIRVIYRTILKLAVLTLASIILAPAEEAHCLDDLRIQLDVIRKGYNRNLNPN